MDIEGAMREDDLQDGMRLVEEMLRVECADRDLVLDAVECGQTDEGFDKDLHAMVFTIGGTRRVEKFTREDLSDAPEDEQVRSQLQARIASLLDKVVPTNRTGF